MTCPFCHDPPPEDAECGYFDKVPNGTDEEGP
jgi:hypothetical protein